MKLVKKGFPIFPNFFSLSIIFPDVKIFYVFFP